jgi:hypothetical protein
MPRPMVAALHSDDKVKPGTHSWGKSQTAISLESLPRRCRRCANYFGADAADSPTQKIHSKDQSSDYRLIEAAAGRTAWMTEKER